MALFKKVPNAICKNSEKAIFLSKIALNKPLLRVTLDIADIASALTCESLQQNTQTLFTADKTRLDALFWSESVLKTLLSQSRLCDHTSNGEFECLKEVPKIHSFVKEEIGRFLEKIEGLLKEPLKFEERRNDPIYDNLLLKTDNASAYLLMLKNASQRRIDLLSSLNPSLVHPLSNMSASSPPNPQNPFSFVKTLHSTFNTLASEAVLSLSKIASLQKEKRFRVEQTQRRKEETAQKMQKRPEKPTHLKSQKELKKAKKAEDKRTLMILKKSAIGLGERTALFVKKFSAEISHSRSSELAFWEGLFISEAAFLASLCKSSTKAIKLQTPKGSRDLHPKQVAVHEKAFDRIRRVFHRYGAVGLDTPVFERRDVLTEKYGEDSKLIFDLKEQGGEPLSLRYDLTVPFARYVAMNRVAEIKRYHIGKVYRRDAPAVSKGKFREFYQCDFDIAGRFAPMLPDAEIIAICAELLKDLELGSFTIRVNHRGILDHIMQASAVPEDKFHPVCSAIDKLDKVPWEKVRDEMVNDKGISPESAEAIKGFIFLEGDPSSLLDKLSAKLGETAGFSKILGEVRLLFEYLYSYGLKDEVSLDFSMARGLDYYTGVIFEATLNFGENTPSIAGGGRYDKLIGSFSNFDIPAIGVSIGIERILAILEARADSSAKGLFSGVSASKTEVIVASAEKGFEREKIEFCVFLRARGVNCEYFMAATLSPQEQINKAIEKNIPHLVFLGSRYRTNKVVQLKNIERNSSSELSVDEVAAHVKENK